MPERPTAASPPPPGGPPPRVCILTEAFHPIVGGAEAHSLLLSRELARRGIEIVVMTRRTRTDLAPQEVIGAARVHRVGPRGFKRLGKYLMMLPATFALVRLRSEYDLIYVCGFRLLGVVGVPLARMLGKRSVLRAESCGELTGDFVRQGIVARSRPLWQIARVGLALRNAVLRRADRFLSITGAIEAEYRSSGIPADRIVAIPNGVDTQRFAPASAQEKTELRRRLGLPPMRRIWCYTGKLNRGKGLEPLLEVWRRLAAEREDLHLVLVGSGADQFLSCEAELREFVAHHRLDSSVSFTGYVSNVADFLRAADFFVLPSLREALSVSVIEALAAGLPSVSTRVGGTPEIIADGINGRLVEPGDRHALEAAMRQLLDDATLARVMAAEGRRTAVERFDIGAIAARHEHLFRGVLGREPLTGAPEGEAQSGPALVAD